MAFELPLPPIYPGGDFIASQQAANALTQSNIENRIKSIEEKYKPITLMAKAGSEMAYQNLMGPQFAAKMMANSDIVASLPEPQRSQAVSNIYRAAMSQSPSQGYGVNNSFNNLLQQAIQETNQSSQAPLGSFVNMIKNLFSSSQSKPQSQTNQLLSSPIITPEQRKALQYQRPGEAIVVGQPGQGANSGYLYDAKGNNIVATPKQIDDAARGSPSTSTTYQGDYFERGARAADIKEEGKERGKLRADALNDMSKEYQASIRLNDSYDEMKNLINDPAFQKMRANIPFFQNMQMRALSKIGTPYEQEMIGTFKSAAQKILANAVNSFEGRKFVGEFKTTNDMKINENDTFNTIVGKMQAGMLLNNFDRQRMSIASRLMKDKHLDQQEAMEIADKQLDRKKIESDIKNLVRITIKNKKTGEIKTIPIHEAREIGVANV